MKYIDNSLCIYSDYEIKTTKEWEFDKDLSIFLDKRTINLHLEDCPSYMCSRLQLPEVDRILLRYCKNTDNNICTIHFLKDEGVHSTIMNFELDYSNHSIEILNKEFFVHMRVHKI